MRSWIGFALALVLACAHDSSAPERPCPPPAEAVATAEPPPAPVRRAPPAPAPAFADPERRAKLAAAFPAIDAYLRSTIERDGLVGLAAGIVIDGELAWAQGYGLRDPARGLPVQTDTAFGVGSITKTITAMAILKLRDEGRLDLDRPAATYLPELSQLVYPTADSPAITIRHLLTHTSGLPRMGNFPEYPPAPPTRTEFLATLDGLALEHPPGQRRHYSNLGVQLLGPLITAVSGVDHRTYIRDAILEPLEMHGAGFIPEDLPEGKLATGHELDADKVPRARPHWRPGAADAAGGLYASVEDLARFAAYNLAAWPARDEPESGPLRRATLREAHTLSTLTGFTSEPDPDGGAPRVRVFGNGLGFGVYATCRHEHVVVHGGKTLNYRASLHMLPRHGVALILLTNLSSIHSSVLPRDGEKILDLLADTGALQPRRPAPAPDLVAAGADVSALLASWDEPTYARVFAPDFRDSHPAAEIEAVLDDWRGLVGACHDAQVVDVTEPRAGTLALQCERGELHVKLRVAPWESHPITGFTVVGASGIEPSAEVRAAAETMRRLLRRWDERTHRSVFASDHSPAAWRALFEEAGAALGDCRLGEAKWTAPTGATFQLRCDRDDATMHLRFDPKEPDRIGRFEILLDRADGPCG